MLMRIVVDETFGASTLRVQGRLTWDGVDELRRACAGCAGVIELDLGDLRDADSVGAAFLQGLVHGGIRVRQASPYVSALLRVAESPDPMS